MVVCCDHSSGLYHFPDLTDELERAIGGVKYGDYILSGMVVVCVCILIETKYTLYQGIQPRWTH